MAETHQYVNRSNLATFLAKIKELIPSSLTFLTKTEAEETYQEKLKYYTEGDESNQGAAIQVDYDGGYASGGASAAFSIGKNEAGMAAAGMPITLGAVAGDINLTTAMVSGDIKLSTSLAGGKAYYNDSEILSEASVIDSLESTSTTAPLSANQGKVLNEKFDDILTKSDVSSDTDVAMLSRMFAFPLASVSGSVYLPSSDTITKYTDFLSSLNTGEIVVCEYNGVKGWYSFSGDVSARNYAFTQVTADIEALGGLVDGFRVDDGSAYVEAKTVDVAGDGTVSITSEVGDVSITSKGEIVIKRGTDELITIGNQGIVLDSGDVSMTISGGVVIDGYTVMTENTGISSSDIRKASFVSALPSNPSSTTLYLIPE